MQGLAQCCAERGQKALRWVLGKLNNGQTALAQQILVRIDDRSHVGEARREAARITQILRFDAIQAGRVAIAITEAATNILKHAGTGKILLFPLLLDRLSGLEILVLDRGPGVANLERSLTDGYSTAGTMGGGLGALVRASHKFDIHSTLGRGTAMRLEIWATPTVPAAHLTEWGAVSLAKDGQVVTGDAWSLEGEGDVRTILVADGLGHGPDAARAARAAVEAFACNSSAKPADLMRICHAALAGTRGAAAAAAQFTAAHRQGSFAGVGNITCRVESADERKELASHNGTLGHDLPRVQQFGFTLPTDAILVLHTDGLATRWAVSDYPGLMGKHAGLIAAVLYRDHERGNDDVTVVVLKNKSEPAAKH